MPKTLMTIGAAAKAADVAIDTVRYYEREGLLASAARTASGYRVFAAADVERLRFIRKAKALGFTLADIADPLRLQDGGGPRTEGRQIAMNFTDYHVGGVTASSMLAPAFWMGFAAAIPAGFAVAWPVNWWLLKRSIKQPCH